jgi:hypothetical protein
MLHAQREHAPASRTSADGQPILRRRLRRSGRVWREGDLESAGGDEELLERREMGLMKMRRRRGRRWRSVGVVWVLRRRGMGWSFL